MLTYVYFFYKQQDLIEMSTRGTQTHHTKDHQLRRTKTVATSSSKT